MPLKTTYAEIAAYTTRDGSIIRELMHPEVHGNRRQSLAEATVPVACRTRPHRHHRSEEIYHIVAGDGVMTLGDERLTVMGGDTLWIPPGTVHWIENTGTDPLKILCACSPPYSHSDTELVDPDPV